MTPVIAPIQAAEIFKISIKLNIRITSFLISLYHKNRGQLLTQGGECVQGERLRKWREKEKMSQEELAEKSNVSRTTIHLIESGQSSTVKIRTLQKLAVVFNKQVKDFF